MFRAPDGVIQRAYAAFGFPDVSVGAALTGYRTTLYPATTQAGQRLNLLVHKREAGIVERIKRTQRIESALQDAGLPVRQHPDSRILRLNFGEQARYVTICSYLTGETIPWEAYTKKHIKLLGWALAAQHQAMKELDTAAFPSVYDEYRRHISDIERYVASPAVARALRDKLGLSIDSSVFEQMRQYIDLQSSKPGQQLLHMDFVRGNVLFATGGASGFTIGDVSLSGVIDFEKAAVGRVSFDMARTFAFLLADCSAKTEAQLRRYFIDSGYVKRGGGVMPAAIELEPAIDLHLLHDLHAFLRHNPYESLHENYHFTRTRDILVDRKMVQYVSR